MSTVRTLNARPNSAVNMLHELRAPCKSVMDAVRALCWCCSHGRCEDVVCTLLPANLIYVSESDILGPNGNLSDIKNLASFERELFEDSSYKYRIKYSYYPCQYHHFEIHALNIINVVMSIIHVWPLQFNQ